MNFVSRTATSNHFCRNTTDRQWPAVLLSWYLSVQQYLKKDDFDLANPLMVYRLKSMWNEFDATVAPPAVKKVSSIFFLLRRRRLHWLLAAGIEGWQGMVKWCISSPILHFFSIVTESGGGGKECDAAFAHEWVSNALSHAHAYRLLFCFFFINLSPNFILIP